jgi:hypothetical protein
MLRGSGDDGGRGGETTDVAWERRVANTCAILVTMLAVAGALGAGSERIGTTSARTFRP